MQSGKPHVEAFKEGFNTVGLAAFAALSAALLNPVPLLAGLVCEAAYLLFVPDSKWYARRLESRYDQEVKDRREALKQKVFPTLTIGLQHRVSRLEEMRTQIEDQPIDTDEKWFREVLRKLDYLMEKFLLFAAKSVQFQQYLKGVEDDTQTSIDLPVPPPVRKSPYQSSRRDKPTVSVEDDFDDAHVKAIVDQVQASYKKEIDDIDKMLAGDENLHNQAVLEKRKEVLQRRSEHMGSLSAILTNLRQQLHLIEDTFGLINDEIRARSPEQVLADIEDVVFQTDSLTETLQTVAPFEQMTLAPGAKDLYNLPQEQAEGQQ